MGLMAILSVALGILTSFGLCSLMGLSYGPMHSLIPCLLVGLGVDNAFVLVQAIQNINQEEAGMNRLIWVHQRVLRPSIVRCLIEVPSIPQI